MFRNSIHSLKYIHINIHHSFSYVFHLNITCIFNSVALASYWPVLNTGLERSLTNRRGGSLKSGEWTNEPHENLLLFLFLLSKKRKCYAN